jgi:hypothetical protein
LKWIGLLVVCCAATAACFSKPPREAPLDADGGGCVNASCAAAHGICEADDVCHITTSAKPETPRCPSGMKCNVTCTADGCENGVDCAAATECTVRCEGNNACNKQGVDCGSAARCDVACIGDNACQRGLAGSVQCHASMCSVTCDGATACENGVSTEGGTCIAHCCGGGCAGGTDTCQRDAICP